MTVFFKPPEPIERPFDADLEPVIAALESRAKSARTTATGDERGSPMYQSMYQSTPRCTTSRRKLP